MRKRNYTRVILCALFAASCGLFTRTPDAVCGAPECGLYARAALGEHITEAAAMDGAGEEAADTPDEAAASSPEIYTLGANETVAVSFDELKTALSQDNGITTVYLGADIDMKSGGIAIHAAKTRVVIDGVSPLDESGKIHTLSEYASSLNTDCMRLTSSSAAGEVVFRNMVITGRNYYGTVYVPDSLLGIIITYQNIAYTGPQITYNVWGTARYIDADIAIKSGNGGSTINEVAEIRYIELGGRVNIDHYSTGSRVFYIHSAAGAITVNDGANVKVTVHGTSMSLLYGNDMDFTVGMGASFEYTAETVFNDNSISLMTIEPGGRFSAACTGSATVPVLSMAGNLTVKEGAFFEMTGGSSSTRAVIRMEGNLLVKKDAVFHVTGKNGFYSAINMIGGKTAKFEDPASAVLYNKSNFMVYYDLAGTLDIEAQQVNYWSSAAALPAAGGLNDPPLYGWKKAEGGNFTVKGAVSTGTSGNFTSITSNYETGDIPGMPPNATTFNFGKAKVLSMGRLDISAEPFYESSTMVTGITAPGAAVRVTYTRGGATVTLNDIADSGGSFIIPVPDSLEFGTVITVTGNLNFLYAAAEIAVERAPGPNALEFVSVPNEMHFETTLISSQAQTAARQNPDWSIIVSDTRGAGASWRLTARVVSQLTSSDPSVPVLDGALVFIDGAGVKTRLESGSDTPIHSPEAGSGQGETTIKWDHDKGLLAEIQPGTVYAGQAYSAVIMWALENTP